MKNFINLFLFVPICFLLIQSSCKKDPTANVTLPLPTQEGKNTIGFTINGEVWVPYFKCGFGKDPCGEYSARYSTPFAAPNSIDFDFERERGDKSSSLSISAPFATITTVGDKIDSIGVNFTGENWTGNTDSYSGIMPVSRFIVTKLDKQAQVISGEFEFTLSEDNRSGKVIHITNGRFDFKFNACKCSN